MPSEDFNLRRVELVWIEFQGSRIKALYHDDLTHTWNLVSWQALVCCICCNMCLTWLDPLKGTVSRDFRHSVFFMNQSHLGHWSTVEIVLHMIANPQKNSRKCVDCFFGIARSRNNILSAFTEAVKVTVYQKIGHMWSCLPHGSKIKF
jgi:hypothetical protein